MTREVALRWVYRGELAAVASRAQIERPNLTSATAAARLEGTATHVHG